MASQLNIKDPQTIANVTELARLTGRSKTDIVREAVEEKLRAQTETGRAERGARWEKMQEVLEKIRSLPKPPPYTDDDYYDEYGLPK